MSRMTAAQVIALGEYLEPDFDPSTLTVSQLLGVFGFHNIRYPTPYTKPKLVQLFYDEIKPKTKKFKAEKAKQDSSEASDAGIKDGVTGEYLNPPQQLRRSSRRSSRAPTAEPEIKADTTKRRRSRQPSAGATTRNAAVAPPAVIEESESEEEEPVRKKASRAKRPAENPGPRNRKSSQTFAEDSGWEDNNVFQSGAEESSPARPIPKPRSRKSAPKTTGTRRATRKVSVPPPERTPSPSPASDDEPSVPVSPPPLSPLRSSKFEPSLSPEILKESQRYSSPGFMNPTMMRSSLAPVSPFKTQSTPIRVYDSPRRQVESPPGDEIIPDSDPERQLEMEVGGSSDGEEGEDIYDDETEDARQVRLVSEAIGRGGTTSPSPSSDVAVLADRPPSIFSRLVLVFILALGTSITWPYKVQSASIGFCDTASNTNQILENIRTRTSAIEVCQRENRTMLYLPSHGSFNLTERTEVCPTVLESSLPVPDYCTPCPEHAVCHHTEVACTNGFIIRPHPVLSLLSLPPIHSLNVSSPPLTLPAPTLWVFKAVSAVLDGIPGLGPVALPPRCAEDPRRKKHIGALGKAIEAILGQERGRILCAGSAKPSKDEDGGEAHTYGMETVHLRESMKAKTAPHLLETFDDTFNEAIEQLKQWGGVVTGLDQQGRTYIAHKTPTLDIACQVVVKSREAWMEWRASVLSTVAVILTMIYYWNRRVTHKVEARRAHELARVALDTLQNKELEHYTDPVRAPEPYISVTHLRDVVLKDEHSLSRRERLWRQVARIVEGNTNVRVNQQEVAGGDEAIVWRWIGTAGRPISQFEGVGGRVVA